MFILLEIENGSKEKKLELFVVRIDRHDLWKETQAFCHWFQFYHDIYWTRQSPFPQCKVSIHEPSFMIKPIYQFLADLFILPIRF